MAVLAGTQELHRNTAHQCNGHPLTEIRHRFRTAGLVRGPRQRTHKGIGLSPGSSPRLVDERDKLGSASPLRIPAMLRGLTQPRDHILSGFVGVITVLRAAGLYNRDIQGHSAARRQLNHQVQHRTVHGPVWPLTSPSLDVNLTLDPIGPQVALQPFVPSITNLVVPAHNARTVITSHCMSTKPAIIAHILALEARLAVLLTLAQGARQGGSARWILAKEPPPQQHGELIVTKDVPIVGRRVQPSRSRSPLPPMNHRPGLRSKRSLEGLQSLRLQGPGQLTLSTTSRVVFTGGTGGMSRREGSCGLLQASVKPRELLTEGALFRDLGMSDQGSARALL